MSHRSVHLDIAGVWQPLSAVLTSIAANTGTAADKAIYYTAANVAAEFDLTAAGRALVDDADASAQRTTLGFAVEKQSGFQEWTGAGSYYTINSTDFVLDRPGIGWINSAEVTWLGAQTVAALSAGNAHYIYIDSTGTIGSTTTRSTSLFQDNIVLFEVLVDSDTPANVLVVKENHSLSSNPATMNAMHRIGLHGYDTNGSEGGDIALNGTLGIQVDGTTYWRDDTLRTTIPDSSAAAVDLNIFHTNAGGKWVLLATQNTLLKQWNDGGTPTNLTGNQRSVYDIRVSKDDIESVTPKYFAIMSDSVYANLALAEAAVANTTFTTDSNELEEMESIRMGAVIISATAIDSVTVSKQTIGTGNIYSIGSTAALVSTDTSNFNGILSAADTTVQSALETIDDMGDPVTVPHGGSGQSSYTDGQLLIGNSVGNTLAKSTLTAGAGITITNAGGSITVASSGAVSWSVITGATNAAVNSGYFCNHAAARVVVTLPDTAPVGSIVRIAGMGAAGWEVAQNAGETIYIDSLATTTGVTGKLQSTDVGDCVELTCFVADTDWRTISSMGNITVT